MNTLESPFSEEELDTLKCVPSRQIARFCSISHATIDKISKINDFAECRIKTINEIKTGIKMYTIAEYAKKCSVEFDEEFNIYAIEFEYSEEITFLEWLNFNGQFRIESTDSHISTNQNDEAKQFNAENDFSLEDVFDYYIDNYINNNIDLYRKQYEVNLHDLATFSIKTLLDIETDFNVGITFFKGSMEYEYFYNESESGYIKIISRESLEDYLYETQKSQWLDDDTINSLANDVLKPFFQELDTDDLVNYPISFKLVGA